MIDHHRTAETARDVILLPRNFPGRNQLIRHLVRVEGWQRKKVADLFQMTSRRVQQLTRPTYPAEPIHEPAASSTLTQREMASMANDYARDTSLSIAEREAAWDYLAQGCPRLSA